MDVADCITVDSACKGELMNNGFASDKESTMCTETNYSYTATQGTGTTSSCIVEIAQESATGHVDMGRRAGFNADSGTATCLSPLRQNSPHEF